MRSRRSPLAVLILLALVGAGLTTASSSALAAARVHSGGTPIVQKADLHRALVRAGCKRLKTKRARARCALRVRAAVLRKRKPRPVTTTTTTTTTTTPTPTTTSTPAPAPTTAPAPVPAPTSTDTQAPAPTAPPVVSDGYGGFGSLSWPGASWRPYAASSPFNTPVGAAPAVPASATYISKIIGTYGVPGHLAATTAGTTDDFAHPSYFASPSDPMFTLHATKPWGRASIEGMRIPIPDAAQAAGGSDGHMSVVTPDGWEYDFWQVSDKPAGGGTLSFSWGGRTRIDGSGLGGDATAANFGNMAGMIRFQELAAGRIDHALFMVLKCTTRSTAFGYGARVASSGDGSAFVYPATHGGTVCPTDDGSMPPMGAHFKLALSDAQIAALDVPVWRKTILTALAHYGAYVGDTGGPGVAFMFESSAQYTSFGQADPFMTFAKANGLPTWEGRYVYHIADGVDWARDLRILAPPAAA